MKNSIWLYCCGLLLWITFASCEHRDVKPFIPSGQSPDTSQFQYCGPYWVTGTCLANESLISIEVVSQSFDPSSGVVTKGLVLKGLPGISQEGILLQSSWIEPSCSNAKTGIEIPKQEIPHIDTTAVVQGQVVPVGDDILVEYSIQYPWRQGHLVFDCRLYGKRAIEESSGE